MSIKKQKLKYKNYGFTLVELIIVITILAILATIAFVSFQGYSKDSRDTIRVSDLNSISKGLDIYKVQTGNYPMPDDSVNVTANGDIIGYQGNIGDNISRLISLKGGKDPLDRTYYTYYLSSDKKNIQLLGLGENQQLVAGISNLLGKTYADNSNRYPITKGKELGIILDKNKTPIQQLGTGGLDVMTATGEYIGVKSNTKIITGTGIVLKDLNPNYLVKTLGGSGGDFSNNSIVTDKDGNIYISGYFNNDNINSNKTIDFDGNTLLGKGNIKVANLYIVKLNSIGEQQWIKTFGGSGTSYINKMLLDSNGNVYIGGYYYNDDLNSNKIIDFGGNTLSGVSNTVSSDGFITKLDNNGNQQWIKIFGGISSDSVSNFYLDKISNIYIIGNYYNDTSNSKYIKDFKGNYMYGNGSNSVYSNLYALKLDNNGNQQWIKTSGGNNHIFIGASDVDENGNTYVGGYYINNGSNSYNIKDFSGNAMTGLALSWDSDDSYLFRIDTNGNQSWKKLFGGSHSDYITSIKADNNGSLYIGGSFISSTSDYREVKDFNGNQVLGKGSNSDTINLYVSKLNVSLGKQEWIKVFGGNSYTGSINNLSFSNGSIYVGGTYFNDNSNINSISDFLGNSFSGKTSISSQDIFISKFDDGGNQQWIKTLGGTGTDSVGGIIVDISGNLYIRGNYSTYGEFKDFAGNSVTGFGLASFSTDSYISKINSNGVQSSFKIIGGKGIDMVDGFYVDINLNLFLVARYHNDNIDTNQVKDFKGYPILGKSSNSAISGAPDVLFQKLFKKDLE